MANKENEFLEFRLSQLEKKVNEMDVGMLKNVDLLGSQGKKLKNKWKTIWMKIRKE